jgi:hypothetical protein
VLNSGTTPHANSRSRFRRIRDDTAHTVRQRGVTRRHAIWSAAAAGPDDRDGAAAWRVLAETTRVRRLLVLPFTSVASDENTDICVTGY